MAAAFKPLMPLDEAWSRLHAAVVEQQAFAAIETTASMEQLAATAGQIARTSDSVARSARDALVYVDQGREAVSASVSSMVS